MRARYLSIWSPQGVASANWLLDIQYAGQISPAILVLNRLCGSGHPCHGLLGMSVDAWRILCDTYTVLLEGALERRASWAAICPTEIAISKVNRKRIPVTRQKIKSSVLPCGPGGKNQKNNFRVSSASPLIGSNPAQLGPKSKSTSGKLAPLT
jgi:hypothetical protein